MNQDTSSAPAQDIDALRKHLFSAMEGVKAGTLDLDKARLVNEIGKTLVDSARVEVAFLEATGGDKSSFLGKGDDPKPPATPGITGVTQHRIRG